MKRQPTSNTVWRHRNGNIYLVLFQTNVETGRQDEYPTTVVYENVVTGVRYSRPLTRWTEESFTFLNERGYW